MKIPVILSRFFPVLFIIMGLDKDVTAQEGYPFMSNFSLIENIDHENFDLIQDNHNNILFANRKGVLLFNSRSWDLVPMLYHPLCFEKSDLNERIYLGCRNGFGYLQIDEAGRYNYIALNDIDSTGEIYSLGMTGERTYFINPYRIYRIKNEDDSELNFWEFAFEYSVTGCFTHNDEFYFTVKKRGLYKAVRDTFELAANDDFLKESRIIFSIKTDPSHTLIGTDNNRIYSYDGLRFIQINLADYKYLDESIMTDGAYLGSGRIALSTILGGVMICNYSSGKTDYIINYNTGLPDDEIFCLGTDNFNGLWLCHSLGVTRIDPWLSIRNYTWYPGLKGNLTQSVYFRGKLYVGSSDGIYVLEEKKDYVEKILIEKVATQPKAVKEETFTAPVVKEEPSSGPLRKIIKVDFKKLRHILNIGEKVQERTETEKTPEKMPVIMAKSVKSRHEIPEKTIRKKKVYSLQSISHSYTLVPGITGRCTELIAVGGHLLAGTNNGLYEIIDNKSVAVLTGKYVQYISTTPDNSMVLVSTNESFFILSFKEGKWEVTRELDALGYPVYSACIMPEGVLWLGSDNAVYKLNVDRDFLIDEISRLDVPAVFSDKVNLKVIDDHLYFFLSSGIYKIENDSLIPFKLFNDLFSFPSYYLSNDNEAIYRSGEKWGVINDSLKIPLSCINIFPSIQDISISEDGSTWIIADNKQVYHISGDKHTHDSEKFAVYYSSLKGRGNEFYSILRPDVKYSQSSLKINFSAPFYIAPGRTEYRHYFKGLSPGWSDWSPVSSIEYPLLPPGRYSVYVQARNIFGTLSNETVLDIHIKPPFYKTRFFYALAGLITLLLFALILRIREKSHLRAKEVLEQKVRERTAEIERQKNEIAEQKNEITDSLYYARRIQAAVLPPTSRLSSYLPEHFVLFIPRDIVSGDFYWSTVKDDKIVIAAADCTGHGVPGAFMSMLGVSFLNEIVNRIPLTNAGAILDALRIKVKDTLSQSGDIVHRDGMDIALCIIDKLEMKMEYAGANNPLYMIRNNVISEIKADKMPIGKYEKSDHFTSVDIDLQINDSFYLFSDGFIDQFGGTEGKKYLSKSFRDLLMRINDQSMSRQKELIISEFQKWKGTYPQVDDILIIGFRI